MICNQDVLFQADSDIILASLHWRTVSVPYINGSTGGTEIKTEVTSVDEGSLFVTEIACDAQYQA